MNLNHQVFITSNLERLLKIYKTSILNEMHIKNIKTLENALNSATNGKKKLNIKKLIKEENTAFKKSIIRTEKYNSEISNGILKQNKNLDELMEDLQDFFNDFTILLLDHAFEGDKSIFKNALLEESDKGTLFVDGKQYLIHTNK